MADEIFQRSVRIERPAAEVFAWHERPGAFQRLCPPWERVEILAHAGGIRDGARVRLRSKVGPLWSEWDIAHRDYVAGRQFRDVLQRGPFAKWEHLHAVTPAGDGACVLTDTITYRLPLGWLGRLGGGAFTRKKLAQMFAWRHATTKADVELANRYGLVAPRRVLVSGASGMVGRALVPFLRTQGHHVATLVRGRAAKEGEITWDPARGALDPTRLEGFEAVIHLSGENVGAGRWTAARKDAIMRSRVDATRTLVMALGKVTAKPAVFVSASAVGFYGDCGDEALTEAHGIGHGFLPEVCLAWETHAEGAARLGVRTALLRFGVVLSPAGGALAKMLPAFRAGLGGPMGTGKQYMSWASIEDVVGALYHAMLDARCVGPVNVAAPQAVPNAEFASELGRVLRRPAVLPVPAMVLRSIFGQMADETILCSTRAVPERLRATGFVFRHESLEAALRAVLGRE